MKKLNRKNRQSEGLWLEEPETGIGHYYEAAVAVLDCLIFFDRFIDRHEPIFIQTLVPEAAVE